VFTICFVITTRVDSDPYTPSWSVLAGPPVLSPAAAKVARTSRGMTVEEESASTRIGINPMR
jgi:hypothetical protein